MARSKEEGYRMIAKKRGSRVQIHTEYNGEFVKRAHLLDGRWRKRSKVWSFPETSWRKLKAAVRELYGEELELR